ncbi:MAG TPA: tetraacyldisaccharide 4'-kinase [Beijerinckiaceae bacterium]|jgi:tetraacyldisaccharide 4'-kinase
MRPPRFWDEPRPSAVARLLRPAAFVWGGIAAGRMDRGGDRADVPVICIGNFTAGGAGKTPTVLAVARILREQGERPAFLSRGYGGRLAGPVRVDPARHGPQDVGDEPLLLARAAPTVVARDRPAGARLCRDEAGASVVVMDDGLQNPSLKKDVSLAVVDAEIGVGNGLCLPAGPLRAPLKVQWRHVDAVVLVGDGAAGEALAREAAERERPVLRARLEPDHAVAARLARARVLAFAGIGRPQKFFATLEACGAAVARTREFPDHHPYSAEEVGALVDEARREALLPVTTEKDFVRIAALGQGLVETVTALPVILAFADEEPLRAMLGRLGQARSA